MLYHACFHRGDLLVPLSMHKNDSIATVCSVGITKKYVKLYLYIQKVKINLFIFLNLVPCYGLG